MTLFTADETKRSVFSAQLKEQLKHKRMIYTKDELDLSTTVGQGMSRIILMKLIVTEYLVTISE